MSSVTVKHVSAFEFGRGVALAMDADLTEEQKQEIINKLTELRSRFQNLHYQARDAEKQARKAGQGGEYAQRLGAAANQARSEFNTAVDYAKRAGINYYSKIRAGETR